MSYVTDYVIRNFKMYYRYLERDIESLREDGPDGLIIKLKDGNYLYYDDTDHTLRKLPSKDMTEEEFRREFGRRLRKMIHERGFTQVQFATQVGIHQPELSAYINGKRTPGFYNACRIANVLHCSTDDLMYGKEGLE